MPILLVFGLAVALLILDMLSLSTRKSWLAWVAAVGFILIGIQTLNGMGVDPKPQGCPFGFLICWPSRGWRPSSRCLPCFPARWFCLLAV